MSIFSVLRHGRYAKLFSAQVIALLGTGMLTVALGLLAYDLAAGSAGAVLGTALTIKMVTYVGVAPVITAAVDRLPRKAVLIGADAIRAMAALCLPLVTQVWQVYLLVFILQSASAMFTPTFQSTIPAVVTDEKEYTSALSLSRLAYDLEAILSPVIAAAALAVMTYSTLFSAAVFGFIGSGVLVAITRLPPRVPRTASMGFWQRTTEGARVFARTPSLRFLMLMNVAVAAPTALVLVNTVVYTKAYLGLDDSALALTLGVYGFGSLSVALLIPRLVERIGVARTMMAGATVAVIGLAAATVVTGFVSFGSAVWVPLLVVWFVLGVATSMISTPSARILLAASTESNRDLVYTAQFSLSHACFLIGYPIAGWLGAVSLTAAVAVLLVVTVAAGAAVLVVTPSQLRSCSSNVRAD